MAVDRLEKEILQVFTLDGQPLYCTPRKLYYEMLLREHEQGRCIETQVQGVRLLLLHPDDGRVWLQRRSRQKKVNPGLYDKSIGGHVSYDPAAQVSEDFDVALVDECMDEMGIAARVVGRADLRTEAEKENLGAVAVCAPVEEISPWYIGRRFSTPNGLVRVQQPWWNRFYVGYYAGGVEFRDGEAEGASLEHLQDLDVLVVNDPELYTEDLSFMTQRFREVLVPL